MNHRPDVIVFDDTTFPSSIKKKNHKRELLQSIELNSTSLAKDKFIEMTKTSAQSEGTFKAIHEANFIAHAVELFEPTSIEVIPNEIKEVILTDSFRSSF